MFVKTALIKCKIENGKLMSGRQFVMSKNILCPSVTLQPFAQYRFATFTKFVLTYKLYDYLRENTVLPYRLYTAFIV